MKFEGGGQTMRTLIIGDITGYGEYLSCYLSRKKHTVILVDPPQKKRTISRACAGFV